jgi:hypothetical protein
VPADRFFTHEAAISGSQPHLVAELAPLLRARKDLSEQDVAYLEDLIGAAVRRFSAESERR